MLQRSLHIQNKLEIVGIAFFQIVLLLLIYLGNPLNSPLLILLLPIFLAFILIVAKKFEWAVLLLLLSSLLFLENPEGLNTGEIIYFGFSSLLFLFTFGSDLLRGSLTIHSKYDLLLTLLILLLPVGIVLGILNGASPKAAITEITFFLGLMGYFAYRKYFAQAWFRNTLLAVGIIILLFVAIRNLIHYREILFAATVQWEAEKARSAANEILLLIGCLGSISFIIYSGTLVKKIVGILLFVLFLGDLIITQSRGYWLAFFVGTLAIWFIGEKMVKRQIVGYLFLFLMIATSIGYFYFNDLFLLLFNALSERFSTFTNLATGQLGASLKERILESQTILEKIFHNPIMGYGFGVTYPRYYYLEQAYKIFYYVHNGYLSIWYKLGLAGFVIMVSYSVLVLKDSYTIYKQHLNTVVKLIALTIFGVMAGMLVVNNTSPQYMTFDSLLVMGLMGLFCSYYKTDLKPSPNND